LEVKIASVGHLADVNGGTSERLIALDFAAKLAVAIAALFYERLTHKRLAPSTDCFEVYFLHAEGKREPCWTAGSAEPPLFPSRTFTQVSLSIVLVVGAVQDPWRRS